MIDFHVRYHGFTHKLEYVKANLAQHCAYLLKDVHVATLVIDISLVKATDLKEYVIKVVDQATSEGIYFGQIMFDANLDPVEDHFQQAKILDTFAKESGIRCFLATSRFSTKQYPYLIEVMYPSWLFEFKSHGLPNLDLNDHSKKVFPYSCLNRNPQPHRHILYNLLKRKDLLKHFIYTFYDRCPYTGNPIKPTFKTLEHYVGADMAREVIANFSDFPIVWEDNDKKADNDHTINHPAYQSAWCNVVTESHASVPFSSEKVWKPIAAGQLFLVAGPAGICSWLNSLGFETFNDNYDHKIGLLQRFELIVDTIEQHVNDPADWWHANRFKIEHNYHLIRSGKVEKKILDPLVELFNRGY